MGLTITSGGHRATAFSDHIKSDANVRLVAMVGNPNVGKSSLFNRLTGMHQHTGNWTGKTVGCTIGVCRKPSGATPASHAPQQPLLYMADLPGCYSLNPKSSEEETALAFLLNQPICAVVVVCDAMNLERNLLLAYQIKSLQRHFAIILCVNLIDEAIKQGVKIDPQALEAATGWPVVLTSAKTDKGIADLYDRIRRITDETSVGAQRPQPDAATVSPASDFQSSATIAVQAAVGFVGTRNKRIKNTADRILCGKYTAIPIALLLLTVIFWITIKGANLPSAYLSKGFTWLGEWLRVIPIWNFFPWWVKGILLDGVYTTLTWVVAVMLPPMAIFFPLFTILEDVGFLPRIAFNFDRCFQSCHACGKQALTMCMGFGCNAAGVTGCRIIDSPRERLIAILTNSFIPCNGKFPTLLAMLAIGLAGTGRASSLYSAGLLTVLIVCAVACTWVASRSLSATCLRGKSSSVILELPPYRIPKIGQTLVRSIFDRTLFVLGRAVCVAAPAGGLLWVLTHIFIGNNALLEYGVSILEPVGRWLGLDGAILLAFILSVPANELTIPILLMIYTRGDQLGTFESYHHLWQIVSANGWTTITVIGFTILFMFHIPCSTTLLTIRKETGKWRWVALAAGLPLIVGLSGCVLIQVIRILIHLI